jgi:predicted ATPase/DNA-binding CsgD family transcriptional regulator
MLGCAIALAWPRMLAMPTTEMPSANPLHLVGFAPATAVLDLQRVVLPVPLTRLVSREVEVAAARAALLSPDVRLVTLTGPGGVGKSRVAIQTAWELADAFAGDVHLVCLATIGDPELLLSAIAQTLGLPDPGTARSATAFQSLLVGRRALLLLDNFEPILAAGPILADLLSACPNLKALVTSRERLRLRGERVLPIPPLNSPTREDEADLVALRQNPGVRLMVQRAMEVVSDFRLTADNAAAIAEIVRRLEGLPLAIELAAARLVLFPPAELLSRLERRLPLLSGGASDLPDRLRTMRDAIAWSYDLLAPEDQSLFRKLSVFANSFTLEAAEWVSGGESQSDTQHPIPDSSPVLDGIASLVDKCLLYQQVAGGETRYAMLELIREFALEQLAACEERDLAWQRHAAWWLLLTERADKDRAEHRNASGWLDRLELNDDDLRAALTWFERTGDVEGFVRLAAALTWLWLYPSHRTEGRRWLTRVIEQARAADLRTIDRTRVLEGAAVIACSEGHYAEANTLAAECLAVSQEAGHPWREATALNLMGVVARAEGEFDRAAGAFTASLTLVRQQAMADWAAWALLNLGTVAYWQGDKDRATALGTEALAIFRRQEVGNGVALALCDLALVASTSSDRDRAVALFVESLEAWQKVGTKEGLVDWLARVATLAMTNQRTEQGIRLLGAVERTAETIGYRIEPPELVRQQHALDAARSMVGDTAFAAAWEDGQRLTVDDAIAGASEFLTALREPAAVDARPLKSVPYGLTPRELDVLRHLIDGRSDRQIGLALCISHRTVMSHVEHILTKLDVDSRTAAATQAVRLGLV